VNGALHAVFLPHVGLCSGGTMMMELKTQSAGLWGPAL
jgi:hypothetical protein